MTWDPDENNIFVIRYQGCMEFVDQHQEWVIQSSTMQSLKRRKSIIQFGSDQSPIEAKKDCAICTPIDDTIFGCFFCTADE
nr:hypothetical protein BaRGS_029551 [Batillaria attramentaria]